MISGALESDRAAEPLAVVETNVSPMVGGSHQGALSQIDRRSPAIFDRNKTV